ncbi:flagellar basal body-associated FliL family protein [Anoxynatronum buryatiense]|uniref:Flagellar protein FliL n=1 Tax=Anoxynatronum buryatiense TaxID=489973 RepID=A0AA45WUC1_9CLOT|nr:flagellar basal body-associated FliL family protein [Anoxynatronum buryatiense]SMP47323.1 flagellar FliL protein [Anoxynatronum buryatiense]
MDMKKIIIISLVAFLVTAILVGSLLYIFVFRTPSEKVVVIPTFEYQLGEFSTNLGSQRSFFRGSIVVETTDKKLLDTLENNHIVLRDSVIKTLIGKRAEDVLDPEGQQLLRQELIQVISEVSQSDQISNVYFVEYIVQ